MGEDEMKLHIGTKVIYVHAESEINNGEVGYNVQDGDGNVSWMSFDEFIRTYRSNGELTFSEALHALLKEDKTIARRSWNAPGQFIIRIPAGNAAYKGYPMQDCLAIKNAQGLMQPGWVPSQGDILAEDWYIVGER